MHINWAQEWDYLYGNRLAIEGAALVITTAFIKTAPTPGALFSWLTVYTWLYDGTHQIFNITNTRLTSTPIPTPPLNKEPEPVVPIPNVPSK